jgi:hypothetical protein
MAQVAGCLPRKGKSLSSNPNITTTKKRKKKCLVKMLSLVTFIKHFKKEF